MIIKGRVHQNNGSKGAAQIQLSSPAVRSVFGGRLPIEIINSYTGNPVAIHTNVANPAVFSIPAGRSMDKGDVVVLFSRNAKSWVYDIKRAAERRRLRDARKAKRKTYGWREFVRGTSTRAVRPGNGERAIAKNRVSQRKLERWVMTTGVWRLGFLKDRSYVVDTRKKGGFDFEIRSKTNNQLVGLVDAKSEFKTTEAQDRQIEQKWNGIPVFLVSRTKYLQLTPRTKRKANGSVWG
jgi:hypothetical protein